jgi:surfactin synthase thioesterase subunit
MQRQQQQQQQLRAIADWLAGSITNFLQLTFSLLGHGMGSFMLLLLKRLIQRGRRIREGYF